MLTTANHTLITFSAALNWAKGYTQDYQSIIGFAQSYIKQNIALLLLPKALELYGTRRQTHFIQNLYTEEVAGLVLHCKPKDLPNIKVTFDKPQDREDNICTIDGIIRRDIFWDKNPNWEETAYSTHLLQDKAWNLWINFHIVDYSQRLNNKYSYRLTGDVVDRDTLHKNLEEVNEIISQRLLKKIYEKFGIIVDEQWFEQHVYANLLKNYNKELADYTWNDIKLPSQETKILPDFVSEEELKYGIKKLENDTWLV